MNRIAKKILALALALALSLFAAPVAFAQDVPVDASSTNDAVSSSNPPVVDAATQDSTSGAATSTSPSVDLQGAGPSVQDTTNTQAAVTGDVLESTTNPEFASSTDAAPIPLIDSGTTTPASQPVDTQVATGTPTDAATPIDEGTSSLDVVAQNIDTAITSDPATTDTPVPIVASTPLVPVAELAPQPEFTFALTGKHISATRKVEDKNGRVVGEEAVTAPLTPTLDNTTGAVTVSGQCSAKEFVVLLFKNPTDYVDDPRSYIVNSAYPCVNGAFTYSITDLPPTLPNGNYYLLVGQQGSKGAWTPITEITEITINKNQ